MLGSRAYARLVVCAILLVPGIASAGRSFYGWLYGTETLPERQVEVQTWIAERDDLGATHARETAIWWGPVVGVTDRLELAFPIELRMASADGMAPTFALDRYGVEGRIRVLGGESEEPFASLVRLAVKRDAAVSDKVILEGDLVASYRWERLHALVDIGVQEIVEPGANRFELHPGAGIDYEVRDGLRLGVEGFGELAFRNGETSWYAVGPDIAWTHGRFWLSAAALIGVHNIQAAPRVTLGIMF